MVHTLDLKLVHVMECRVRCSIGS